MKNITIDCSSNSPKFRSRLSRGLTALLVPAVLFSASGCRAQNMPAAMDNAPQPVPVSLANPGFEDGLTGWNGLSPKFQDQISLSNEVAHSGAHSLRIDTLTRQGNPFLPRNVAPIEAFATYRFSAWVRAGDEPGSVGNTTQAALKIEYYNAAGQNTSGYYAQQAPDAHGKWTQLSVTAQADADTVRADILVRLFGKGVVYFDDVSLDRVTAAPDIGIPQPAHLLAAAGQPGNVELKVWLKPQSAISGSPAFKLHIHGPTGLVNTNGARAVDLDLKALRIRESSAHLYAVTATLPGLDSGEYLVSIGLEGFGPSNGVPLYVPLRDRRPANLTRNGTLLWNGKPFFPIGIYHAYHPETSYPLLAQNGFNSVQGAPTGNIESWKASLDLAAKCGIAVDVPIYVTGDLAADIKNFQAVVQAGANHPAVLCYKLLDEPDTGVRRLSAPELPEVYRTLKALDGKHPFELTLSEDETLPFWKNFCDLVQRDRYPLPAEPIHGVLTSARGATQNKDPWQNLTFVVQSGWTPDLTTQPTYDQARAMVYLALIGGAKGISWYSMHDPDWDLTTTPLWPRMKQLNGEIAALAPMLMGGRDVAGITGAGTVPFLAKLWQGKLYVLLCNDGTTPVHVALELPARLPIKNATVMGEPSRTVVLDGQKLDLQMEAGASATVVCDVD